MGDPHSMSHFKAPDPDLRNPTGTKNVILGPDKRHQLYMFSNTQHNNIVSAKSDCSLNTSTSLSISRENNDYFKATSSASIISLSSTFCSSLNSVRDSRRKEIYLHQHQNNWSKMIIAKKEAPSFHRRDLLLMESCEINRTITDRGASSGDDVVSLCSIRNKLNHNNSDNSNNNPSSNYKSCTELLTTSMWKVVVIMRMVMMTISKFHQRQQPQRQPLHYNYNSHRHNRVNSNCLRTFIVSVILCLLSCTNTLPPVHGQPPPLPPAGFLDFDNLPVTRFSCEGKVIGGYYADVETGCQMFHVCTLGQKDEIQDIKFLCLNGTVFDQETRVCERVDEVDCSKAEQFFDLNLDLYVSHATTQKPEDTDLEEEDDVIRPVQTAAGSKPKSSVTTTTTRQTTTTTTTPTPSPRTRPPSQPLPSRSRSPPVISGSASSQRQQQQSSSQQEEEEEEDEDDRPNGNNAYTSFNYYLKTPHSHVASGYNSQSRQSYLINQPTSRGEGRTGSSSSGPNSSGSSPNAVATAAVTSTGRKVSSASGPKTIVYSSTSTSSSSTQRPKTVVVVKATLAPSKSILRPKTLATPRTTTTTTPVPPKYELDDQYDEYYDEEDYPVEQQAPPPSSKQSSFQQTYAMSKPALISGPSSSRGGGYDFRDGRSTKGVANAGQTLISTSTGRSPLDRTKLPIAITSKPPKVTSKPVLVAPANIKVISSEFVGNNSTEEPYYYEDDYPDDASFQQQQYASPGYSSTSPSGPSKSTSSTVPTLGRGVSIIRNSSPSSVKRPLTLELSKMKQEDVTKEKDVSSSDYYDDDAENVNAHDHHFTHVDVPRIPFAKPNVPRVLVTNGKPFLPRLRRQSHYHHNYFAPYPPQPRQSFMREYLLPAAPSNYPGPYQRSTSPLLQHSYHRPSAPLHPAATNSGGVSHPQMELRREARAKAIQWGRDPFR